MQEMFLQAYAFNADIGNWDTAKVAKMQSAKVKGRKQHLGYFKDKLEAARAYETALAKLRPEGPRQFTRQYLGVN
jgi:surface protein